MIDTIFSSLRKLVVLSIALIFAFVVVYTPQDFSNHQQTDVPQAEAFLGSFAVVAAVVTVGAIITNGLVIKETILDGIAWAIAKQVISNMVSDLVDWINSGFKGKPAFITNIKQYFLEAVDEEVGRFIESLGGDLSFLCSPFQLDIQLALAVEYDRVREDKPYEGCRLSDIQGNLEDFLSGNFIQVNASVDAYGNEVDPAESAWHNWLKITKEPNKYTSYGAYLESQKLLEKKAAEAKANADKEANWGNGMKSNKVCETVDNGSNRMTLRCAIVTPAKQISDALSKSLGAGKDTLVTADEISEIIGALIAQLGNKAITGAAGLLGLSANTGYTYNGFNGGSYTAAAASEVTGSGSATQGLTVLQDGLKVQNDFKALADRSIPILQAYIANSKNPEEARKFAQNELINAQIVQRNAPGYTTAISEMITRYQALEKEYADPKTTSTRRTEIRQAQSGIVSDFQGLTAYSEADLQAAIKNWDPSTY